MLDNILVQEQNSAPTYTMFYGQDAKYALDIISTFPGHGELVSSPRSDKPKKRYVVGPKSVYSLLVLRVLLVGKNIGQQYCWCSLMWLMPLRSLSNCDYELNFYLRLILGPIHSNQVMGTDPVGSHHGTRNSQSNSINPTYPY